MTDAGIADLIYALDVWKAAPIGVKSVAARDNLNAVILRLAMPWQPAKTAPANKSVLACNALGFIGRAWKSDKGRWNHIGKATHWMPLPAPPTAIPEELR